MEAFTHLFVYSFLFSLVRSTITLDTIIFLAGRGPPIKTQFIKWARTEKGKNQDTYNWCHFIRRWFKDEVFICLNPINYKLYFTNLQADIYQQMDCSNQDI
jgi:hypothetical protein